MLSLVFQNLQGYMPPDRAITGWSFCNPPPFYLSLDTVLWGVDYTCDSHLEINEKVEKLEGGLLQLKCVGVGVNIYLWAR